MKVARALISVSDKTGLKEFAEGLAKLGVEIISTGGTRKFLESHGVRVRDISDVTGFPEILDGRVKTLHPKVHGGLLAKRADQSHCKQVKEHGISFIDMVVVNLYPFKAVLEKNAPHDEMIENIDIGGPSMLRSAAKNYADVVVVCDPCDYASVLTALQTQGDVALSMREQLAAKVFCTTSEYDAMIAGYFAKHCGNAAQGTPSLPVEISLSLAKQCDVRYGENPHQHAALYVEKNATPHCSWEQLHGKELSYNNFVDIDAAWHLVKDFDLPTVAIIKHNNPCGVGTDEDNVGDAYIRALATDALSAYGGIVAVNTTVTEACASEIAKIFTECVVAPEYEPAALALLTAKKNLRVMRVKGKESRYDLKRIFAGFLVQDHDTALSASHHVVTQTMPTPDQMDALLFAWVVAKHVKSNAIVIAQEGQTLGIGAGQMSRVDSVELAARKAAKAGLEIKGAVLASDAFFPFRDSIDAIAPLGVKAIIQPGGSVRDEEVIAACNEHGIAMVFTGQRHFRH